MPLTRILPHGLDSTRNYTVGQITANTAIIGGSNVTNIGGPKIQSVQITDSSYVVKDDTSVSTAGGFLRINGSGFVSGAVVLVNNVNATATAFVNSTTLNVQVPALSAGTYTLYVVNPDGGVGIRVNGITYSATPTWVTGSTLPGQPASSPVSIQLNATSDSTVTYALAAGSSLPTGLTLSSSGLISGTTQSVANDTTFSFIIEAIDTELQESPRTFSVTITIAADPDFRSVNMLLSANTPLTPIFVSDVSSSNNLLTITGDTRPSIYNPYTPGFYSNLLDGSSGFFSVSSNTAFSLTGDFTIEAWVYLTTASGVKTLFTNRTAFTNATGIAWQTQIGSQALSIYTNSAYAATSSINIPLNTWTHVALTRSGSTITQWVNGVSGATATNSSSFTDAQCFVGANNSSAEFWPGHISNFRIVKGQALYTSTFTPSTSPLTTTSQGATASNVSLLACQSNRFFDSSPNNFTITRTGNITISSFQPFTLNTSFSSYGSAYFSGKSGSDPSQITTTGNLPAFGFGTGDFTVEFWINPTVNGGGQSGDTLSCPLDISTASTQFQLRFYLDASNVLSVRTVFGTQLANPTLIVGAWTHVAVSRVGTNTRVFINGTQSGTTYTTLDDYGTSRRVTLGNEFGATTRSFTGYISDLRLIKGTGVYSANFTPSTVPSTATSNTTLLTCQTNQPVDTISFVDSSTINSVITRNGNSTQGSFGPFGENWSNYFDGTGDFLVVSNATAFDQDVDFTVEMWLNIVSYPGSNDAKVYQPNGTGALAIGVSPAGKINIDDQQTGNRIVSVATLARGVWYHIALVRNGPTTNNLTLYINGTADTTVSYTGWQTSPTQVTIGRRTDTSTDYSGFISNLRVVRGSAVYTSNFTPSTTPLQPIAGTVLLTCADNRFIDDSPLRNSITRNGDVSVEKFAPFTSVTLPSPAYSAFFDGTGDYLTVPDNANFEVGANVDFTVEAWFYATAAGNATNTIVAKSTSGVFGPYTIYYTNTSTVTFFSSSNGTSWDVANAVSLGSAALNTWHHVAVSRQGSSIRLFLNGVLSTTLTSNAALHDNTASLGIGGRSSATELFTGFISNVRIVLGTAVYTSAFTPSTSSLTSIANTTLLTCQSNTFVDNSTNNFAITVNGDARPIAFNPFTPSYSTRQNYTPQVFGGSMYFDGTDYLTVPNNNSIFNFGTGNFTIEAWVYMNVMPSADGYPGSFWIVGGGPSNSNTGFDVAIGSVNLQVGLATFATLNINVAHGMVPRTWYHIAVVRNGNTLTAYRDGIALSSVSVTGVTADPMLTGLAISAAEPVGSTSGNFNGFISNLRIVKGRALYTSAFIPQNSPLTNVRETVLLLNGTSAGIYDSSMMTTFESAGNARVTPSFTRFFGNQSLFFDGTGDGLFSAARPTNSFGTTDFTIEFWYNPTTTAGTNPVIITNNNATALATGLWTLHAPHSSAANKYSLWVGSSSTSVPLLTSTSNIATNTWTFVAITRNGNTWRMFINGTIEATATHTGVFDNGLSNPLYVGYQPANDSGRAITGYISDLRFTRGLARYTSNFTSPSFALFTRG